MQPSGPQSEHVDHGSYLAVSGPALQSSSQYVYVFAGLSHLKVVANDQHVVDTLGLSGALNSNAVPVSGFLLMGLLDHGEQQRRQQQAFAKKGLIHHPRGFCGLNRAAR